MRQSIRALGWAVTLSTIIFFTFLVTAVYSVYQTVLTERSLRFMEFQSYVSDNVLILSMPVAINNNGFYDITEFEMESILKDLNGTKISSDELYIQEIKTGTYKADSLNLTLSLEDVFLNRTDLSLNDSELKIDVYVGFKYAHTLAFRLTVMNTSMPWGAPLYGLSLKEAKCSFRNETHFVLNIFLEAENHSFFDVSGNLYLKAYNEVGEYVGSGRTIINLPVHSKLSEPLEVAVKMENPSNYTGKGTVEGCFEISAYECVFKLENATYD